MRRNSPGGVPKEIVDHRRAAVARMKLRGLSSREIERALGGDGGIRNPITGQPYDHTTIWKDLKALDAEWKRNATLDTATLKARQLAEHQEVKREAARTGNLFAWLKALDQEARLTGTYAPTKLAPTDPTGEKEWSGPRWPDLSKLTDAEVDAMDALLGKLLRPTGTDGTVGEAPTEAVPKVPGAVCGDDLPVGA